MRCDQDAVKVGHKIIGAPLTLHIDTLCVHGDTPGADELAARLRRGLEAAGITVQAIGD